MFQKYILLIGICAILLGCNSEPSQELAVPDKVAVSGEIEVRMSRMEQDILSMRAENERRMDAMSRDMDSMNEQLQELVATLEEKAEKQELDGSTREFARESMQRILDLSRKVMDKLEKELNAPRGNGTEESVESAPESGKTI